MVACTARGHSMLRLQQQHRDAAVRVALSRMAVQPAGGPLAVKKHYRQAGTISGVNAIISEICLAGAASHATSIVLWYLLDIQRKVFEGSEG